MHAVNILRDYNYIGIICTATINSIMAEKGKLYTVMYTVRIYN